MTTWSRSTASAKWKGKQRTRDEGEGGADGIVLPLDTVPNGPFEVAYTISILVGPDQQNLSLQVDTGSSDMWIASTSCSTSACSQTQGRLYDPGKATQTGVQFAITYLSGSVSGPIVWDDVNIGGYDILNQALAAATNVQSEPLSHNFDGILGLALPLNSIIARNIPPVTGNSPDGAAFASNLFGMTPVSTAPSQRFISLSLSRPIGGQIPSLMGIGRHPSEIVSDPSTIDYSTVASSQDGILFWKANVMAITVYVDGVAKPVSIGRSATGAAFPTAVLDTGVPSILTTSTVANGIYGALGIGPAADGQYYVPCTEPLNMTITLDQRPETSLHPLDLTSQQNPSDTSCLGLIQSADAQLANPGSDIGDMILGVPFLRNVYTVMGYETPNPNGTFTLASPGTPGNGDISPSLGLLGLTNPTVALQEFHTVRVLKQPLNNSTSSNAKPVTGKKTSLGIDVLIGLLSFFGLCFILFSVRFFILRRSMLRKRDRDVSGNVKKAFGQYRLARRGSHSDGDGEMPSEDTLRSIRYQEYIKKERMLSEFTVSSGKTQVDPDAPGDAELGYRKSTYDDPWDPATGLDWGQDTIAVKGDLAGNADADILDHTSETHTEDYHSISPHQRPLNDTIPIPTHARVLSGSVPLLAHTPDDSADHDDTLAEFGLLNETSMAGVGTAARSSRIDPEFRHNSVGSIGSVDTVFSAVSVGRPRPRPSRTPSGPRPSSSFPPNSFVNIAEVTEEDS